MKIIVTYEEIFGAGRWDEFCIDKGLNEYCIADGADEKTEVELTVEEAKKYGFSF